MMCRRSSSSTSTCSTREFKKRISGLSPAAAAVLKTYGWPGNVRELRNVVERAMLLAEGDRLEAKDFGVLNGGSASGGAFELPAGGVDLEELERSLVVQALKRAGGNQTKAAGLLGLNRDQIRYRIEKFKLIDPCIASRPSLPPSRASVRPPAYSDARASSAQGRVRRAAPCRRRCP